MATFEYPHFTCTWTLCYSSSFEDGWAITFQGRKATLEMCEAGYRVYAEPWEGDHFRRPSPGIEKLPGGLTQTGPHIANFLDCVKSRQQPNATVEIGHQAVRTLHLANIAIRVGRKVRFDPVKEEIVGDEEANRLINPPMRAPWHL